MTKKVLTLAFPVRENEILLGLKKRGFGAGLYNGFGGKLEGDETIEEGMKRELWEEVGIEAVAYQKLGVLTFYYTTSTLEVHIFKVREFEGVPTESDEMAPLWYRETEIPLQIMWPDDAYWLPLFLEDKPFVGAFWFSDEADEVGRLKIVRHELNELKTCYFS